MIEVKIDNKNVLEALERLSKATDKPSPVLRAIGESLVVSTKKRFETSTAPDGKKWQPNSDTTLRMALHGGKINHKAGIRLHGTKSSKYFKENGSLKKSGERYLANKKPLIGKHTLASQIYPDLHENFVRIGSNMEYAAMQQFGGVTSSRSAIPGKRIPARPFLGISGDDEAMITRRVNDYLRGAIK